MALLSVSSVSKKGTDEKILHDITFKQNKLERIAIAGETGSGKSTLLKVIAGLTQPDSGEVLFKNERVLGPEEKLVPGHSSIVYLSQHFELPKFLRVEQVLTYANTLSDKKAAALYEVCRITHLVERRTDQLSGGERQRIAIARLLSTAPDLLLLDEPFAHLDMANKRIMKSILWDISKKLKITCILVSHDPLDTLSWAERIIVLQAGKVVQLDKPEIVYAQPANEYVAGLFGNYNFLEGKVLKKFCTQTGRRTHAEPLFIRPENFKVVKQGKGIKARVEDVHYYGGHYEWHVRWSDMTLVVRSFNPVVVGDIVYLASVAG